jgi:integrase
MEKEMKDTNRFFFPDEWKRFIKNIQKAKNLFLYELQFQTGARFDEAMHVRPIDFDFDRNNLRLWKTKTKAKKGEKTGKPRTISLSTQFSKAIKKFCKDKKPDEYLFKISQAGYNQLLKNKLKKLGVKDYSNFSSHNIRKTHGMYLKALGIDIAEICTRLGHDYNTYIKHYGSADVFSEKDMRAIRELMGDLYFRNRRF